MLLSADPLVAGGLSAPAAAGELAWASTIQASALLPASPAQENLFGDLVGETFAAAADALVVNAPGQEVTLTGSRIQWGGNLIEIAADRPLFINAPGGLVRVSAALDLAGELIIAAGDLELQAAVRAPGISLDLDAPLAAGSPQALLQAHRLRIVADGVGTAAQPLRTQVDILEITHRGFSATGIYVTEQDGLIVGDAKLANVAERNSGVISQGRDVVITNLSGAMSIRGPPGAAGIDAGGGKITLTSDALEIAAPVRSAGGQLVLQPLTPGQSVGVASGTAGEFNLSDEELDYLGQGFGRPGQYDGIVIGRADGQHRIEIGAYCFRDSVTFRTPLGGGINVLGALSTAPGAELRFVGSHHTTTLNADVYTNGDNKLIEDSVVIGAGRNITISTGPLGGDIIIEGLLDGTADPGGLTESLTIIAGTGDVVIQGDIGSLEPLANLTIVSAGRVTLNGNVRVSGLLKIVNTSGLVDIGLPLVPGGQVGNVLAGSLDIASDAQIIFEGAVTTTGASQAVTLAARPIAGNGDIAVKGNLTTAGNLTILTAHDVRFSGVTAVTGDLTQVQGLGATRFDKIVSAHNLDLAADYLVFDDRISVAAAGHLVLTADEIDFNGGPGTVSSAGVDTSLIVLRPSNATIPVKIGTAAGANLTTLDLSNADIAAISDKFLEIVVGWEGSPNPAAALQRKALTVVSAGGSTLAPASVEIKSPGSLNDLRFTAQTSGAAFNDVVIRIFDDDTLPPGQAEARYYAATKLLTINVNLFDTPASAVLDAVNLHTKQGDTAVEYTAGTRPFTVTGGADYGAGTGQFETVISDKTSGGADAVTAVSTLPVPGADNDILFTSRAAGGNGITVALLNRDVPAVGVQYDSPNQVLTIVARLVDSPNGVAHTRTDIIAAVNAANVALRADPATADNSATGELELGRTDLPNRARLYGASLRVSSNVTAPQAMVIEALFGGITTPVAGTVVTPELTATAASQVQLNTNVDFVTALVTGNGDIAIGDTDAISVRRLATVNGGIYLVAGDQISVLNSGTGISAGGTGNLALRAATAVVQGAAITTAGGSVSVQAVAGEIAMDSGALAQSNGGNIRYAAGTNAAIATLNAGAGRISVVAGSGLISDENGAAVNLSASQVRLEAGLTVATANDALEISATTLAGQSAGGIFVTESDALTVDSVSVTVQVVNTNLSTSNVTDVVLDGLRTTANGPIVLQTVNGTLTVSKEVRADGTGNLRLAASGVGHNLNLSAPVTTGSGSITLLAGLNLNQGAMGDITSGGGTIDLAAGLGDLVMVDGAVTQSGGGNIRYLAAGSVALGGLNAGTGAVSVVATVGSITDAGDTDKDTVAAQARFFAGVAIGAGANPLEANVGTLAAQAGTGAIYLVNDTAVTVDTVGPLVVNRVQADGATPVAQQQTDSALSDLVAGSHLVLRTVAGGITVKPGAVPGGISSGGNVLLQAQGGDGDISLEASVATISGSVTILAARNLSLAAEGDVTTTNGTLDLEAQAGTLTMADGAVAQTAGGNIRIAAGIDVLLGGLLAGAGQVSVEAGTGVISDNGDTDKDIVASAARLAAGAGIGNGANLLDTAVATIAAAAGGNIHLADDDAVSVGTVGQVPANRVQADATVVVAQDPAGLGGLTTTAANGRIVQVTLNGSLTIAQPVSANGSGNILLQAQTASANDKDLLLNASVASGSGRVSAVANRNVVQAAAVSIVTGGTGTIDVEAERGSVTMADGATAQSGGGAIRYAAAVDVTLGRLLAGTGDVSVVAVAGSITDNGNLQDALNAGRLRLNAGVGIGLGANALDTTVGTITARAAGGGIYLANHDSLMVGTVGPVVVYRVKSSGTTVLVTDVAQSGETTTAGNGPIVQRTLAGSLTVSQTVMANGSGNILLQADGATSDVTLDAPVVTSSGSISVIAARDVIQSSAGDINNPGGTIDVEALAGSIVMADGALAQTGGGNIRYAASNDVTLGGLDAGTGTVSVAAGGDILDGGDLHKDITAERTRLTAVAGIGLPADALDLAVATIAAQAGAGLFVNDADALTIGTVAGVQVQRVSANGVASAYPVVVPAALAGISTVTGNSSIAVLTLDGDLTVGAAVSASGSGNILLQAQAGGQSARDVLVNAMVVSASGSISVVGHRHVAQAAAGDLVTGGGGTITVEAQNGSITMSDNGTDSATAVTAGGNIRYRAAQNIALGGLSAGNGDVSVTAVAGAITDNGDTVTEVSGDEIRLAAGTAIGTGANALEISGNEIAARSSNGGIFLREQDGIAVDSVGATAANRVQADGSAVAEQDAAALNGLATMAANGPIVLMTLNGSVTVNQSVSAHGTGNILLRANTAGANDKDITLNALVSTGSGNISVVANRNLSQAAAGDLTTTGGTIEVEAVNGSIVMADGAVSQSGGGNLRYRAFDDIAIGGLRAGSGAVSIATGRGSVADAGDADKEITAARVRFAVGGGVGSSANHLDLGVSLVAGQAVASGFYVTNDSAVAVDTVPDLSVWRVDSDGSTPAALQITDAARSDLVVGGNLVLRALAGSITINDGTVQVNGAGVAAGGNLLLQTQGATGDLVLNSGVGADGSISLIAARNVVQGAASIIGSRSGTVDLQAVAGAITMADGALTQTSTGNIRLFAVGDITLGALLARGNSASVVSTGGSILDGGDLGVDVEAASARLVAGVGIGTGANHLDISLASVAAQAAGGGIFLANAGSIAVQAVGPVVVNRVDSTGATPSAGQQTDPVLSDLVTTADNGAIVLVALNGSITINDEPSGDGNGVRAHGAGNIRLETRTTGANDKSLVLNAAVRTTAGRITLLANADITQAAAGDLVTASGSIDVEAVNGGVTMADGAVAQTGGGTIRYKAATNVTLGSLNAAAGDVSVIAGSGSVLDGGDTDREVSANRLRLAAGNGIGTGAAHLDTTITTVAARAGTGGIYLADDDALTVDALGAITVSRVDTDGTAPIGLRQTDAALTEVRTTAGDANIVLTALNGALTLNQAVVASGDGNIRLAAQATAASDKDVAINAAVESGTGDLTILASRHVTQSVVGTITTGGGVIAVEAATGSITMQNGALASSSGGNIRYWAAAEVALGGINAGSGSVSITASSGAISDNGDLHKDIAARGARLWAGNGIGGAANALEIAVGTLAARAGAGGLFLLEDDDVVVDTVGPLSFRRVDSNGTTPAGLQVADAALSDLATMSGNGSIVLQTLNGNIAVNDGASPLNGAGVTADGSGNILLESQSTVGNDKDVVLSGGLRAGTGNLTVIANRDLVLIGGDLETSGGGSVDLEARTGSVTLLGSIVQTEAGDIRGKAAADITVGYLFTSAGNVSLLATAGTIWDGGDALENVTANGLRLAAGSGVGVLGTAADAIETNVAFLSARAGAGGVNIVETNNLSVNDVSGRVQRVKADATTQALTDAVQSDVATLSGDGSIVLRTLNGSLVLDDGTALADGMAMAANGAGNVLLSAGGAGMNLTANADIVSGRGHVTVLAANSVVFSAGADVRTDAGGSIDVEAGTGSVSMNDNSLITTGLGEIASNIRVVAALDVVLGGVSAAADVSITAIGGSILDGGDAYVDVVASGLRLVAGVGIGTLGANANALETTVSTVTARAAAGGVNLLEMDALTVGSVSVTVQKVSNAGTVTPVTDATQSDVVTTSGNGSIVLQTVSGRLTLNDGSAPADGVAVSANGSGNVLLIAGGASGGIQVNADIVSGTGNISLTAGENLAFGADGGIRTGGSINLQAAGSVQFSGTALVNAGNGDIRIVAAVDAVITGLSTTGNVSIIATAGSILEGGDDHVDVQAGGLRLNAAIGIGVLGTSANALDTSVTTVSGRAAGGGINIQETNGITVGDVAVTVQQVLPNNTVVTIIDPAQSDLITSNNGAVVLRATSGTITLNDGTAAADGTAISANGSGNVLVQAADVGASIAANVDILSGTGHVTVFSQQVTFASGADIRTGGSGTVSVLVDNGSITMSPTSVISAATGDVRLWAWTQVVVGAITTTGSVSITAASGSVMDAGVAGNNVTANRLRLSAGNGVGILGTSSAPLKTEVTTLSATAAGGGINLLEATSVTVDGVSATVQQVRSDGGVTTVTDATQNDVTTTAGAGSIVLRTVAGSLTLNEGTPSNLQAVSANGAGKVLLSAGGVNSDLIANSDIRSDTGHVTVLASRNVVFNDLADIITGGSGTIDVEAASGSVIMSARSQFFGGLGDIRVMAVTDVIVGNLSNISTVSVISATGSILDGSDNYAQNVFANGLRLMAGNGVGVLGSSPNAIEINASTLSARAGAGGVNLSETDQLTVTDTSATIQKVQADGSLLATSDPVLSDVITDGNGSIRIATAAGSLTLNDGTAAANSISISANGSGNILLVAGGATSDLAVNADVRSGSGHVTLTAGRGVALAGAAGIRTGGAGTIDVEADSGSVAMSSLSELVTNSGDIRILTAVNAVLGSVTTTGNVSVTATSGSITDAGVGTVNVSANQLRLVAGTGVGTAANPLVTSVAVVSGRAGSGGINVRESNAVLVGDTGATVQKVQANGATQAVTDLTQSDLITSSGNGWVILRTLAGSITLADGTAPANSSSINANGSGVVLLSAAGTGSDVVFNASSAVGSGSGHVTILAAQSISMAGQTSITTGGTGTIDLEAGAGSITMSATASVTAATGDIRLLAAVDIALGSVTSSDDVSVTATSGWITDGGVAGVNVSANQLRLVAGVGIGRLAAIPAPLKTLATTLSARATSGGVSILESNGLEIGDTTATIQKVQSNASVVAVVEVAQSDVVTTAGNGSIVIRTNMGSLALNDGAAPANNIAVNAHGSGNVLLSTVGSASDITANADILSGSGHVSVLAGGAVVFAATADIRTGGAGTIDVAAWDGSLTMNDDSLFLTGSGDIRLLGDVSVTLGGLSTSGNASIRAALGSILDGGDSYTDVIANSLRLFAGNGVGELGASANAIETDVSLLSARAGSAVNVLEATALIIADAGVTVQRVEAAGTVIPVTDGNQSDVITTFGNGSIVLRTLDGSLTLTDGMVANGVVVRAAGGGNVLLSAGGTNADISSEADVLSGSGHITLLAARELGFVSGADIRTSRGGSIDLEAGTGSIRLSDNTQVATGTGDIRLWAAVDVALGGLDTAGNASLTATAGSILHGGNTYRDVIASGLRLVAGIGVGVLGANAAAIETTVTTVSARAGAGGINLLESDALVVGDTSATVQKVSANGLTGAVTDVTQSDLVTASGNGAIVVQTLDGGLTLNDGTAAADGRSVSAHGSGNVALLVAGVAADAVVNADVFSGSGHLTVTAGRTVAFASGADLRSSGAASIVVTAHAGSVAMSDASLFAAGSGGIRVQAQENITLGGLQTTADVSLIAVNGSILDGGDTYLDVVADALRVMAGGGVGVLGMAANAVETTVATLSASAGAGGINLLESDAVTVDDVAVTVQRVQRDASTTPVSDEAQSDLVARNGGALVLRTVAGSITLNDGQEVVDTFAVSAAANVLVEAVGAGSDVLLNAAIASNAGHVTVLAGRGIVAGDYAHILAGGSGTVDVEAAAGSITLSGLSYVGSDAGDVRLFAANDVVLGGVGTAGNASITAAAGSILDGGDAFMNAAAAQLRLTAGNGIGTLGVSANALEIAAGVLSARAAGGGINLIESDGLAVGNTAATVQKVRADGATLAATDGVQSDLVTTAANGSIVLRANRGSLVLNDGASPANGIAVSANGAGNILLSADDAAADLAVNADVLSGSGSISLLAARQVVFGATTDVRTSGAGTVDIEGAAGSVLMADGSTVQTAGGNIRVTAGESVAMSLLDARTPEDRLGNTVANQSSWGAIGVRADAGSVREAGASAGAASLYASNVLLASGNAIGGFAVPYTYRLQFSSNLITWTDLTTTSGTQSQFTYDDVTPASGMRFYRVLTSDSSVTAKLAVPQFLPNGAVRLTWNRVDAAGARGALRIEVATVAATAGAGGINLLEATDLAVANVGMSVNRVGASGAVAALAPATGSDLRTLNNGSIVLQTVNGRLVLNDGASNNIAVSAHGSGNILLAAGGAGRDVVAAADLLSGTGHITVLAARQVTLAATADIVTSGPGTIDVEAGTGNLVMNDNSRITAGAGDIRLVAAVDVALGGVSTTGNVSVTAAGGAIVDAGDAYRDVAAGKLRLRAGTAVGALGAAANAIETAVGVVSIQAVGGINLLETDGLTVDDVAVAVQKVQADGKTTLVQDAAQSDVVTTGNNGSIVLETLAGTLALNDGSSVNGLAVSAHGSGNIRLASGGDLTAAAGIASGTGHITMLGATDVTLGALASVRTSGAGTVDLQAAAGSMTMAEGAGVVTDGRNIRVQAARNVILGLLDARTATDRAAGSLTGQAGWGSVLVAAGGSILEASAAAATGVHIHAAGVQLTANGSIGVFNLQTYRLQSSPDLQTWNDLSVFVSTDASFAYTESASGGAMRFYRVVGQDGVAFTPAQTLLPGGEVRLTWQRIHDLNALEIESAVLSANAGIGGVNLLEQSAVTVDTVVVALNRVGANGGVTSVANPASSDLSASGVGAVVLRTLAGGIVLNDGVTADNTAVRAAGTGNVLLAAGGNGSDVQFNAGLTATGGNLSVLAGRNVTLAVGADLRTTGAGTIEVEAAAGSVVMGVGTVIQTSAGNVRVKAAQNVVLGCLDARTDADRAANTLAGQSAWGSVSVLAASGAIRDADMSAAKAVDVFASAARFVSGLNVGEQTPTANPLETELATIAILTGAGGLNILDRSALRVGTVGTVPANRVQPDGAIVAIADAAGLTGAVKTGGLAAIVSDLRLPIENYPVFEVLTVLKSDSRANTLTGLYEQTLRISNPTGSTIDSVRIYVENLPAGASLAYPTGTDNGVPYVQYNRSLDAGQSVEIVIEYRAPTSGSIPTAPVFYPTVVAPLPAPVLDRPLQVNVVVTRQLDNHYLLTFGTLSARTYYIEYSDDGLNWTTVLQPVVGTGATVNWLDLGPPKTYPDSDTVVIRYYRVLQI